MLEKVYDSKRPGKDLTPLKISPLEFIRQWPPNFGQLLSLSELSFSFLRLVCLCGSNRSPQSKTGISGLSPYSNLLAVFLSPSRSFLLLRVFVVSLPPQ